MNDHPPLDLTFPCPYPVKIMGKDEDDFFDFVRELVSRHVPEVAATDFSARGSGGGKYLSVSVTFIAHSREQVDALYHEIGSHKRILFAL